MMTLVSTLILTLFLLVNFSARATLLEEFPHLEKFNFVEPKSNLYLGLGVAPVALMNSKIMYSFNLFQVHYVNDKLDIEIISTSMGKTITQNSNAESNHFIMRTIPKYKIYSVISVGPMLGLEFVRFANLESRLFKSNYATPKETFTTHGAIFGVSASETFKYKEKYYFKINQLVYKQAYSIEKTSDDWEYIVYDINGTEVRKETDKEPLKATIVYAIEFSLLF